MDLLWPLMSLLFRVIPRTCQSLLHIPETTQPTFISPVLLSRDHSGIESITNRSTQSFNNMQLGLRESLPALVAKRFIAAKEGGHLIFSHTHLSIINSGGISVGCALSIPF